MKASDKGLICH